jgi:membrane protein DedA with SNARE-associated domain
MPEWIVDLFARYGYAVVFVGVFLENAGLPVPGETALLAGAALAHYGRLSLPRVIVTAIAAAILGDNLGFLIGRRAGRGLIERYGWRIGLTRARLDQFNRFFARHGAKTVFIARFITGLRVFCAVLAGASRLRWSTFLFYNATGAVVWSTTIALVGYALGESWDRLEHVIGRSGLIAFIIVAALAVVAIVRGRRAEDRLRLPE